MPTVKRYEKQEKLQAAPNVSLNPNAADAEAFGGGESLRSATAAGRDAMGALSNIAIQARQQADEVNALEADLKLSEAQTRIELEAKKMRGKDAAGAIDYANEEWKAAKDEIGASLSGNAKNKFDAAERVRASDLNKSVQMHTANEFINHDKDTTNAVVENAKMEAARNFNQPDLVAQALYRQTNAIIGYGQRNGWSDDQIANAIITNRGETHATVIDAMIGAGQIESAEKYYDKYKNQLVGDKAKSITSKYIRGQAKALEEQARYEIEQKQEENYKGAMISMFDKNLTLSELQHLYRMGAIKESQYNSLESKMVNPAYNALFEKLQSDPETYNAIREAQMSGKFDQAEILDMINRGVEDKRLIDNPRFGNDPKILTEMTRKMVPASPRDQRIVAQGNNLRDFGERYFQTKGNMERFFGGKDQRQPAREAMVREFYERVDKANADEEMVDEIAKQVIRDFIKRDFPEVARMEDMPHVIVNAEGKVERLFRPEQKTKLKPAFTITRNPQPAAEEPKKKKEK